MEKFDEAMALKDQLQKSIKKNKVSIFIITSACIFLIHIYIIIETRKRD